MPAKKKKNTVKIIKKASAKKATPAKKKSVGAKKLAGSFGPLDQKTNTVYIDSGAFFPLNGSSGYVDFGQDGRCAFSAGDTLSTPIVLPVGAVLTSFSVHYTNSTSSTVLAFFLRNHADRHSPSGETEMSFITLAPGTLAPDNYLTSTVTSFPNGGIVQDRFLHYLQVPSTGNWGNGGKLTVRGVSFTYNY